MTVQERDEQSLWRDTERCYRAVSSRDARFDGQFITAVRTTGIYCRPSCPARTPQICNVRFYPTAAAAQSAGYRACRRCLPDAVPGSPEWNVRADLAGRAMRLISDGVIDREGVSGLAQQLGYSERHIGRVLAEELGAGPLALARAHRAHSARLLIELSDLPLSDVAFAAGFASIRQFNDTIREVFATTPTTMRTQATNKQQHPNRSQKSATGTQLSLRLPFRRPFAATDLLDFFASRRIAGVEDIEMDNGVVTGYGRTLSLPHGSAVMWLRPQDEYVHCAVRLTDVRDLGAAVSRARRLFDLDADPQAVDLLLSKEPSLTAVVAATPGLRMPGAVDGPEIVIRAMLGQQVSVASARTAAGKLSRALGERISHPHDALTTLFPAPAAIAERGHETLSGPRRRVDAIIDAASALANNKIDVHVGADPEKLREDLLVLPGIGAWTADYVLMRVLGSPDILLTGDLVLRKGAALLGLPEQPNLLAERARPWRPWRSYAGMYLWKAANG